MCATSEGVPSERRAANVWAMRLFAAVGLVFACYLAWSTIAVGSIAGCGKGAIMDCDHVLQSRFSKVLGVPVSIPAAGMYAVLLVGLFFTNSRREGRRGWAWTLVALGGSAAAFAAVWFVYVQVFQLHKLCWYCLAVHSCSLTLVALLLWRQPLPLHQLSRLAIPGLLATVALAAIQYYSPEPKTYELTTELPVDGTLEDATQSMVFDLDFSEDLVATFTSQPAADSQPAPDSQREPESQPDNSPFTGSTIFEAPDPALTPIPQEGTEAKQEKPKRYIDFRFAKVKLNTYDWPILGSPDAPHVLLELFDYTCPHCRRMNVHLSQARNRYGDQLAILVLPVPLNRNCNPYYTKVDSRHADACELARLALSIWQIDRTMFPGFHDWLLTTEPQPSAMQARQYAATMVDADALRQQMSGSRIPRFLAAHAKILQQAGGVPLPRVESESFSLKGQTNRAQDLFRTLEDRLGVRPAGTQRLR